MQRNRELLAGNSTRVEFDVNSVTQERYDKLGHLYRHEMAELRPRLTGLALARSQLSSEPFVCKLSPLISVFNSLNRGLASPARKLNSTMNERL